MGGMGAYIQSMSSPASALGAYALASGKPWLLAGAPAMSNYVQKMTLANQMTGEMGTGSWDPYLARNAKAGTSLLRRGAGLGALMLTGNPKIVGAGYLGMHTVSPMLYTKEGKRQHMYEENYRKQAGTDFELSEPDRYYLNAKQRYEQSDSPYLTAIKADTPYYDMKTGNLGNRSEAAAAHYIGDVPLKLAKIYNAVALPYRVYKFFRADTPQKQNEVIKSTLKGAALTLLPAFAWKAGTNAVYAGLGKDKYEQDKRDRIRTGQFY